MNINLAVSHMPVLCGCKELIREIMIVIQRDGLPRQDLGYTVFENLNLQSQAHLSSTWALMRDQ